MLGKSRTFPMACPIPYGFPMSGLLVVSGHQVAGDQEIDERNGQYPTEARIWNPA